MSLKVVTYRIALIVILVTLGLTWVASVFLPIWLSAWWQQSLF
jgi:hypothetical protein